MSQHFSHQARKRFGQNFLHDPHVIQQIVHAVHAQTNDTIVEIGPGKGALTEHLIQHCQELHVVEIDRDLAAHIQERFASHAHFHCHLSDALKINYCSLTSSERNRLVGNLPYNISTPLLFHILKNASCIEDMHFMLQKEVVSRMQAAAGSREYGRLSVMIQYHCDVEHLFDVGPHAFNPPPRVNSAIVRLIPHQENRYVAQDYAFFSHIVNQAFSQRRKTLRNALKNLISHETMQACDIDPGQRPETLDVAAFVCLANASIEKCGD